MTRPVELHVIDRHGRDHGVHEVWTVGDVTRLGEKLRVTRAEQEELYRVFLLQRNLPDGPPMVAELANSDADDDLRVGGACCDNVRPRIAETTGRVFCASCRKYLDAQDVLQNHASGQQAGKSGIVTSPQNPTSQGLGDEEEGAHA